MFWNAGGTLEIFQPLIMKWILCSFFTFLWIAANTQNLTDKFTQISHRVETFKESEHVPGVAIAITSHGELIYAEGFGYADLEQNSSVNPLTTRFRIGSISKSLTASVLAKQLQQGLVDLDNPVQHYLPSYPSDGDKSMITLRLLGGHLAGIRHYNGNEFLMNEHYTDVIPALDIFKNDPLLHKPGSKYAYSSYGFNLISAVMQTVAGKPFLELMDDELIKPLGLLHTGPDMVSDIIPDRTGYYVEDLQGNVVNAPAVDNSYKWAGGGFLSSATDLCRFANALLGEDFWTADTRKLFITSQKDDSNKETHYGIGFRSDTDNAGRHWFGHSGGSVGGTSNLVIYPEAELVIVVLTNKSNVRIGTLNQEIAAMILD